MDTTTFPTKNADLWKKTLSVSEPSMESANCVRTNTSYTKALVSPPSNTNKPNVPELNSPAAEITTSTESVPFVRVMPFPTIRSINLSVSLTVN